MVPEYLQLLIAEWHPRSGLYCGASAICKHLCLFWRYQEPTAEDLTCVVDCEVHMLPPLSLPVQLDEALGAEEVHTIFTKDRSIVMLAFKANKTIDHALEVVAQVWTGGVEGVHEQEALVGIEQATLHALAGSHSVLIGRANQLLHIRGDMCSAFPRRVGTIEAVLTEVVFALLTFDNCRLLLALLAHDDAVGLPDYINLVLLFAYLPEEINWIPKVNNVRRQIKLLLDVSL
mmetsp:Transcript_136909/g.237988  ORF Transcript_136909/g.237988 Transcript_136909/m.237988 type:complete len:232 (+) Transcript_136909:219-914(+)